MDENKKPIDVTHEFRRMQFQMKAQKAWDATKKFCSDNKEWLLAVGIPLAGKAVMDTVKGAQRRADTRANQRLKDNYIWDPKHGMYFETRRKMTTNQRLEFARRRDNGEGVEAILRSMNILKK